MTTMTRATTKTTMAVTEAKATTSLQWQQLSDGGDGSGGNSGNVRSHHLVFRLGVDAHHAQVAVGDLLAVRVFVEKSLHI